MVLQTFATSQGFNQLAHLHSLNRFYAIYTPGIYAAGYIVFALTYVRSLVHSFVCVRSLLSVTFVEFTSKFLV